MEKPKFNRRNATAYHEAGHAVAAYLSRYTFRVVSIEPKELSLGHVVFAKWSGEFHPDHETDRRTTRRVEAMICTAVAGNMAQWIVTRRNDWVGADDNEHARRMAERLCGESDEAISWVAYLRIRTRNQLAVAWNWAAVRAVGEALLERRTLRGRAARRIIRLALESGADGWPLASTD